MTEDTHGAIRSLTLGDMRVEMIIGQDAWESPLDVDVHTLDGCIYHGTFVTLDIIRRTLRQHERTGEDLSGTYYWGLCIVVREMTEASVLAVVHDLHARGMLSRAMERSFPP